jgi:hypothetical protein
LKDELLYFRDGLFYWHKARRTPLRAKPDAYYARLYSLTRDELRYILDKAFKGEL